jgi:3-isopropylmalate dehydratase small subunit
MEKFTVLEGVAAPLKLVNVDTDKIVPKQYLKTIKRTGLGKGLFAELRYKDDGSENPAFILNQLAYRKAKILVAGENFGCGSSREQAVSCLKGYDLTIVARSFARIFIQNAINLGLDVVTCPTLIAAKGDDLDVTATEVFNRTNGEKFSVTPLPQARQSIIDAGGLIAFTRQRLLAASR